MLVFTIWTGAVRLGLSGAFSGPLDRGIRSLHGAWLQHVDRALGLLGTPALSAALVLSVSALAFRDNPRRALALLIAFGAGVLTEVALKLWLFYPATGSYPSGHALRALFLALLVARLLQRRWLGACLIAIAVAVGLSRISAGNHVSDEVLGGWLLGWSLAAVAHASPAVEATRAPLATAGREREAVRER